MHYFGCICSCGKCEYSEYVNLFGGITKTTYSLKQHRWVTDCNCYCHVLGKQAVQEKALKQKKAYEAKGLEVPSLILSRLPPTKQEIEKQVKQYKEYHENLVKEIKEMRWWSK